MSLLSVKDLVVRFRTHDTLVHAVNGVSFDLETGEAVAIVGESGCGKSVTSLAIMGLLPKPVGRIEGGQIEFNGLDLIAMRDSDMRRLRGQEIAMIFQDPMTSLNPVLTIGEQMAETVQAHRNVTPEEARRTSIEILSQVGIAAPAGRLRNFPHELSGGMRQRVMIAMALALKPRLLIADEPTTALDVTIQAQVLELIRRLTEDTGTALMLITHDLGVVAGMTRRVLVMYAGLIVEAASTSEVFAHPRHPYTVGLLHSVPRRDLGERTELIPIEGRPPDQLIAPEGCPFAPRCRWRLEACWSENPRLVPVDLGRDVPVRHSAQHLVACHNPPTPEEAETGWPLRDGFSPAPAPPGADDALGPRGGAGPPLPDEFEASAADSSREMVIDADEGPLGAGGARGSGLPVEPGDQGGHRQRSRLPRPSKRMP
jgi:oligopeptide transport system ATP-binding protein